MKKIIALILATIMVMLAVAACGGGGTSNTTEGSKNTTTTEATTTTDAMTTTEKIEIPDPVNIVVYYAKGEDAVAINLATNESAGKLTLAEGAEFELVQGKFYVAEYYNGASKALAEVGSAFKTEGLCLGLTNRRSADNPKNPNKINGGSWWKSVGKKNFDTNMNMDVEAMNAVMANYEGIGEFGTLTVTSVANGEIIFESSIDGELFASDMNVKFAYITYDGKVIKTATNTTAKTPITNATDILRYALDIGNGKDAGYAAKVWQSYLDNYGAPGSTTMCQCDLCKGAKSLQAHDESEWNTLMIQNQYNTALTRYNYIALDATALKTELDAKDAALAAAQTAFDTAVAANAEVAALKAAAEAEGATDEAKKAYTDAIAADATLKALNQTVTDATAAQKTATTNYNNAVAGDTNAEQYTADLAKWTALYEAFNAAYAEAADLVLWDKENVTESYLYKQFAEVEEEARAYPTYVYFYDAATETYTVYVTSAKDANVRTSW